MPQTNSTKTLSFTEFVVLMALMTALVAFSIDAMLPALPEIGNELGVRQANDSQLIISWLFIGMAFGHCSRGWASLGHEESQWQLCATSTQAA